jgi:DNA transposition AAA+ family ATPase
MRNIFVETKNVKRFEVMIHTLLTRSVGIERFGLIFGDPGLGKSEAAMWLINHLSIDAVFIRVVKIMSTRWLLEELVCALGLDPAFRAKDLFDQAKEALTGTDRLVIFDEIDYLTHDSKVIETIRDLGDLTNAPFVFVGMHAADKKLRRYRHLWRRFSQVIHFEPLDREDVSAVLKQVCEVKIDESVVDAVFETPSLTLSLIYRWAQRIEGIARSRGLSKVSAEDLFNRNQEDHGSKTNQRLIKLSA